VAGNEEHSEREGETGSGWTNGPAQGCPIQNTHHSYAPDSVVNDPLDLVQSSKNRSGASALLLTSSREVSICLWSIPLNCDVS
jgi:hypothetical protein